MKILIDARLYGLENAGLGRYLVNLITGLGKIDKKNDYTLLLREKYFKQLKLQNNFRKVMVDCRHYSFSEQIDIPRIIKQEKPDLVHFPHFNVSLFPQAPYIVTVHDLLMHKQKGLKATTLKPMIYFLKRLGYRCVFDRAVRRSTRIIVPSKFVRGELVNFYNINSQKSKVTYEGVDLDLIKNQRKTNILKKHKINKQYFLYVGNVYPHKNIEKAIEAIHIFNKRRKEKYLFLIVSARDIFIKRLEKYISKHGYQKDVKLLGFVEDKDLFTLHKNSTAFLYPSLSEGFGLPGLEAMASGTLCLASDIKVFKEVYRDNAIYFDPRKRESIKEVLEKTVLLSQEERKKMIIKSRDFVKRYSWDKMARQTLNIYENSLSIRQGK